MKISSYSPKFLFATIVCCVALFLSTGNSFAKATTADSGKGPTTTHIVGPKLTRPNAALRALQPNLSGNQWNGQDPANSGCWDSNAYVVLEKSYTFTSSSSFLITLWYSPDCETNWADFQIINGTAKPNVAAEIVREPGPDGSGYLYEHSNPTTTTRAWSPMVYAPNNPTCAYGFVSPETDNGVPYASGCSS